LTDDVDVLVITHFNNSCKNIFKFDGRVKLAEQVK